MNFCSFMHSVRCARVKFTAASVNYTRLELCVQENEKSKFDLMGVFKDKKMEGKSSQITNFVECRTPQGNIVQILTFWNLSSLRKQPSFFAPGRVASRETPLGRERRRTAVFAG